MCPFVVTAWAPLPFAFITHISSVVDGASRRIQAILVASRVQAGPLFVPAFVSWVALPPVAGMSQMFVVPTVPANAIDRLGIGSGAGVADGEGACDALWLGVAVGRTTATLGAAVGEADGVGEPPLSAKNAAPTTTSTTAPTTRAAMGIRRPAAGGGGGAATAAARSSSPQ